MKVLNSTNNIKFVKMEIKFTPTAHDIEIAVDRYKDDKDFNVDSKRGINKAIRELLYGYGTATDGYWHDHYCDDEEREEAEQKAREIVKKHYPELYSC